MQSFLLLTSWLLDLKVEEALQKFLQSKGDATDAILQRVKALTEKEKQIEGEAQVKGLHALQGHGMFELLVNLGPYTRVKRAKLSLTGWQQAW